MGKGIDAARADAPDHTALLDGMKDQLLIAFLRRLTSEKGGELRVPVAEIDATGRWLCAFRVDYEKRDFVFELRLKQ